MTSHVWAFDLPDEFKKAVEEASNKLTREECLEIYDMISSLDIEPGMLASFVVDNPPFQIERIIQRYFPPEVYSKFNMARNKSKKGKGKAKAGRSESGNAAAQTDNAQTTSLNVLDAPTATEEAPGKASLIEKNPNAAGPSRATEMPTGSAGADAPQGNAPPNFYVIPNSVQRLSQGDYKGYLDRDGCTARGIVSFWNLDVVEETWPSFTDVAVYKGVLLDSTRVPHAFPGAVHQFHKNLRGIIAAWCTEGGFRGGAFAERINMNSSLMDMIQFIQWSPVMLHAQRLVFHHVILKLWHKVDGDLLNAETNKRCGKKYFKQFDEELEWIGAFFQINSKYAPPPLPNDISDAWLKEFGPKFTANYRLALAGHPAAPFKVATPRRTATGMSIPGYELGANFRRMLEKSVKYRAIPASTQSYGVDSEYMNFSNVHVCKVHTCSVHDCKHRSCETHTCQADSGNADSSKVDHGNVDSGKVAISNADNSDVGPDDAGSDTGDVDTGNVSDDETAESQKSNTNAKKKKKNKTKKNKNKKKSGGH